MSFEDQYSYPQSADGTLVIMVVRAKHLPNRRKLDKQSPYVVIRLSTTAKKTPSDFRAGQTPEWTHEIRFDLSRDKKPILKIDILDETKNEPTPIGNCEIDASIIFSNEHKENGKYIYDKWYDLTQNGRRAGMLYLEMTFYPSAPVLPPKMPIEYHNPESIEEKDEEKDHDDEMISSPTHDVFVNSENSANSNKSSIFSKRFRESANSETEVFVKTEPEAKGAKKYAQKFTKFKNKLNERKPISALWGGNDHLSQNDYSFSSIRRDISPISNYEPNDEEDEDIEFNVPPVPPHYPVSNYSISSISSKPLPSPPKHRKPPVDSTSIPFSADSIGLDDDELPTKVYMLDEQVKSLSYDANKENLEHAITNDEIDPKYYAPTPSEHFNQTMRFQSGNPTKNDLKIDNRTNQTGYLGNGKFSPSIFQRIIDEEENKPRVPPKIPQGLTEMEYYILEKEKYLRDLQGKRS
ncbi:unnamed protein product [Candida verbasci]|uniref:C2 domain-containing protein n=1 Tax=Candida verbasci TaxID=1227364 RepID=A0A9W4TQN9_9ASCO|nr:unnamed protein product [Candida verbasci]